ncbi:SDR family oxidoreductase [Halioxenophilus aromaticivorans]|uniref:SDR family oxidoreductase n=1 Tax=Halioxenophilus aromaticivorans TaxID=1306992 RepID=A0AAV3TYC0_9ALTE
MANVFLIGATGGIGSRLATALLQRGHQVSGLFRDQAQRAKLIAQRVTPVFGDLMNLRHADMRQMIEGHDAVVFSAGAAGSGENRTTQIDGKGPVTVTRAMEDLGLTRFYLVSAFPEAGRGRASSPGFEHYMQTKKAADSEVCQTALDWVIVRPGTLTNEITSRGVRAGYAIPYGEVAREYVAQFLAELIDQPSIRRRIIELTNGSGSIRRSVAQFMELV